MPEVTYIIRFMRREHGHVPCDEIEHLTLADAWEAVRLFAEPESSEIYTRIELIIHNWAECTETIIFSMDFPFECLA